VSTGRTLPTGVGAPILLDGLQVIGRVRPLLGHPQISSIAPTFGRRSVPPARGNLATERASSSRTSALATARPPGPTSSFTSGAAQAAGADESQCPSSRLRPRTRPARPGGGAPAMPPAAPGNRCYKKHPSEGNDFRSRRRAGASSNRFKSRSRADLVARWRVGPALALGRPSHFGRTRCPTNSPVAHASPTRPDTHARRSHPARVLVSLRIIDGAQLYQMQELPRRSWLRSTAWPATSWRTPSVRRSRAEFHPGSTPPSLTRRKFGTSKSACRSRDDACPPWLPTSTKMRCSAQYGSTLR
jgi:hypothetical protein